MARKAIVKRRNLAVDHLGQYPIGTTAKEMEADQQIVEWDDILAMIFGSAVIGMVVLLLSYAMWATFIAPMGVRY